MKSSDTNRYHGPGEIRGLFSFLGMTVLPKPGSMVKKQNLHTPLMKFLGVVEGVVADNFNQ